MSQTTVEKGALATGGLAAILASACCLGPLLLVSLGLGGAWIGNLTLLAPLRPVFLGIALTAMVLAYRRIYRSEAECKPGEICALPETRRVYKLLFWIVATLILIAIGFPHFLPLFY